MDWSIHTRKKDFDEIAHSKERYPARVLMYPARVLTGDLRLVHRAGCRRRGGGQIWRAVETKEGEELIGAGAGTAGRTHYLAERNTNRVLRAGNAWATAT